MAWIFTTRLFLLPFLLGASIPALAQSESRELSPLQLEEKFQQAYTIIEERYIERVQTGKLLISGITEMLRAAGLSNLKYSDVVPPTHPRGSRKDNFEAFRLAIQAIRVKSGAKVDLDTLVSGMIRGMVSELDDGYSSYLEPEKNRELVKYLKGETESFGG
ncbi:MAG: hypothetical protein HUU16_08025, partial [Candidatus Omnitrophica bacterium]|nr:hypothetical protein [Candidatus Omnitrophota bacterium]